MEAETAAKLLALTNECNVWPRGSGWISCKSVWQEDKYYNISCAVTNGKNSEASRLSSSIQVTTWSDATPKALTLLTQYGQPLFPLARIMADICFLWSLANCHVFGGTRSPLEAMMLIMLWCKVVLLLNANKRVVESPLSHHLKAMWHTIWNCTNATSNTGSG